MKVKYLLYTLDVILTVTVKVLSKLIFVIKTLLLLYKRITKGRKVQVKIN